MGEKLSAAAEAVLTERFGHDTLISLATTDAFRPYVRIVNGYYENGSFYVITNALSGKMRQLSHNPSAAVCAEWFSSHGVGENIGHICDEKNTAIAEKLKKVFSAWYNNGDVRENDPNTCILRITLTDAILFSHGTKYDIDFTLD